ncbi:MAG: type IV toxin-antitoxin system AbiEi family antitoxin, partial [Terriglobia bacterium]
LQAWMPKAAIRAQGPVRPGRIRPDGILTWKTDGRTITYVVEEKRNFRFQDASVVAEQLNRLRAELPAAFADARLLLVAPHVRAQQAALLERAGIDYVDLAGNAHLKVPGLFVHVEGRRPIAEPAAAIRRPHKAWIKMVMALLVQPELVQAPYRLLAEKAAVALGTVPPCMKDLAARGLLLDGRQGRKLIDRPALVAIWVQAYVEALRPKLKERRFQMRANDKKEIWNRLRATLAPRHGAWALTGADAAERRTHYFRTEATEIYAPIPILDDRDIQKALVAQPAAHAGNLLVIEPPGPLAIPTTNGHRIPVAPDLLAYAELRYRGTEQALEAAQLILPMVLGDAAH